jgi:colanic acid/amylovoran biosynthesis glycosyltransferase
MKIAFLIGEFPNLSETFVLNQIIGLIKNGHEVEIYATVPSQVAKFHTEVEEYNLLSRTYYFPKIPKNYFSRCLKGFGLFCTNFLKDPIVLLRSLNVFRYGKKTLSLRLLYATIPLLRKRPRYDVIQCHFGTNGLKGLELREIGAIQGKLCTTFHGLDISGNLQIYGDRLYDQLFEQGDIFLPISEYWRNRLIKLGCEPNKIIVHRMGIDIQKFTFTCREPPTNGQIRLVTIARLVEKKGLEYGIRAVAKLAKVYPNIEYSIIGNGTLREFLEQLIQELDVGAKVKLLGWRQREEVIEILNRSDVLLAPSVTSQNGDQEGIPVVLMEAMAMGLPVISTQHSGIPELVEHGVSGFLVPERDTDGLAEKIKDLIEHPELCVQIGQKGRMKVEESYNINQLNNQLVGIFQHLQEGTIG